MDDSTVEPSANLSAREKCVDTFLRAWLCGVSPLSLTDLKRELEFLGRPAKNAVLTAGGLEMFIARCRDLEIREGRVYPVPTRSSRSNNASRVCAHSRSLHAKMNTFTRAELAVLNRHLRTGVQLEPRSGDVVSALQKRSQLDELRRRCDEKRSALDRQRLQLADLKPTTPQPGRPPDSAHQAEPTPSSRQLDELVRRRDKLLRALDESRAALAQQRALDDELRRVDCDIERREDQLERFRLKTTRVEEQLVVTRKDLFFESQQHESAIGELLRRHSADADRTTSVLDAIVREKCAYSRAVLMLHVATLDKLLDRYEREAAAATTCDDAGYSSLRDECRSRLARIDAAEEQLRKRLTERSADISHVSQLAVVKVGTLTSALPSGSHSVILPPLVNDVLLSDQLPQCEPLASQHTTTVQKNDENACPICLQDIDLEPSESLGCSHNFHTSCLAEMHSAGFISCPLCRRYEPSPVDFPSLSDSTQ